MRQWAAHELRGANAACDARLLARPITHITRTRVGGHRQFRVTLCGMSVRFDHSRRESEPVVGCHTSSTSQERNAQSDLSSCRGKGALKTFGKRSR